jgi:LPS-assembly protein
VSARESFEFNVGEKIRVLSDTAFRRTTQNVFEAVGNVIITHSTKAIYGEKASLSFETGEVEVLGNVRYVGPTMTLYGSKLKYNFKSDSIELENARIMSDAYTIIGQKITRASKDSDILAKDAEFTTCKDCPESWSVFGSEVRVTPNEYIRINQAYIKVRGVVVMYIPYIVLPIKKERETGFLFSNFGVSVQEGVQLEQPFFWAINDSSDMTLVPTFFGKRGLLNQFQYRQMLGEKKWFEVNSLQGMDRVYEPRKLSRDRSGETVFRHFSEYEHHYSAGQRFNHHFHFSDTRDLDTIRDYEFYNSKRLLGPELGGQGFVNYNTSRFDFNAQGTFYKNMLIEGEKEFDHSYVQTLPRLSLSMAPETLLRTKIPGLRRFSFGGDFEYTRFKQNHIKEKEFIRNAHRFNVRPYIDWQMGYVGPFQFQTKATFDYQDYRFPTQKENKNKEFTKSGVIYESQIKLELERLFGVSYKDTITLDQVDTDRFDLEEFEEEKLGKKKNKSLEKSANLVGTMPEMGQDFSDYEVTVSNNGYRHSQEFLLKHFFLSDQKAEGSPKFLSQIKDSNGQFDRIDALRDRETLINDGVSRTQIPLSNSLELQWNNSLVMKSAKDFDVYQDGRYLRDNFNYKQVAHFNVSQGYDLDVESEELDKKLTRLHINTGFSLNRFRFDVSEYYFYDLREHLFSSNMSFSFDRAKVKLSYRNNSFSSPVYQFARVNFDVKLNDLLSVRTMIDYDFDQERTSETLYGVTYTPPNNCWQVDFNYGTTLVEKSVSFNVMVNFDGNGFSSIEK